MIFPHGLNTCKSSRPSSCVCCSLSGWSLFEYVIFCIFLWWICFLFMLTLSRQSKEWNCRLLTFVHGSVVSYSALRDIVVNGNQMAFQNVPLSDEQKGYLSFMLSYFIFDFMWIKFFGNEPWVIHFHHVSSILVIAKVMASDFGGLGVPYGVAGLELTNPYLQIRWFLRTYGCLNKPIHTAVELWFFFLFFAIRLLGGSILFYYIQFHSNMDFIMKFLVTTIYLVSLLLAWDIFKYVKKKYWTNKRLNGIFAADGRAGTEGPQVDQAVESDGDGPPPPQQVDQAVESDGDGPPPPPQPDEQTPPEQFEKTPSRTSSKIPSQVENEIVDENKSENVEQ